MLSPVSLEERTKESVLIVEGEVVSRHSFWDSRHQNIYTSNLINVHKVFKGNLAGDQIQIITEGGTVGHQKQVTTPELELGNSDMGVFFCEGFRIVDPQSKVTARSYRAYGSVQGFIRYNLSDGTASEPFRTYTGIETDVYNSITGITDAAPREIAENKRLTTRHNAKEDLVPDVTPTISTFSPTIITAGTDQILTITGTGFGTTQGTGFVEFKDSDKDATDVLDFRVKPLATDYVSWSDTEIKVLVPSEVLGGSGCAGTGTIKVTNSDPASVTSAGTLTVEYAYANVDDTGTGGGFPVTSQNPDLVNDNTTGGYTFQMESAEFIPTAGASTAFSTAMNTWTCASGVNWIVGAATAVDVNADDGVNVVRFDDGAELGVGVLGQATSRYDGCAMAAGYFTWEVSEIDVRFNDSTTWEFGPGAPSAGESDFESVALHELGHGHQLKHVILVGAVMHRSIGAGTSARVLSLEDKAGSGEVMDRSVVANICGTGPMVEATGVGCGPTAAPASISGRITAPDGAPLGGVTMNLDGARTARAITDSNGNYSFRNIETDNFYTVTPSLVNYHFSPASRSFSLLANMTDAVFTAERDAVVSGNPIDTADYFVRQHYLDFLGREPDESGFNFWGDQLRSCGTDAGCLERRTINVSAAYFLSIEFQETGGLVDGLTRASYSRRPRYAEFMPDTRTVAQGVIVGEPGWAQRLLENKQAFVAAWVERAEFRAAYDGLSNASYVDTLISHTGVSFSQAERDALVSSLGSGSSRAEVLRQIAENDGFVSAKRNQVFVMMQYFGYLQRDPDENGFQFWLNKLNQFNGNFEQAEMVKAFLVSGEYRGRFAL